MRDAALTRWKLMREFPEISERIKLVAYAQKMVKAYVAKGELVDLRPWRHGVKCVDCGRRAQCYDHRDYRKPLRVEPVCKRCNSMRGPGRPYFGLLRPPSGPPPGGPLYLFERGQRSGLSWNNAS